MSKHNVERANKQDIEKALEIVAKTLGVKKEQLKDGLLGSTQATLAGKKEDSGDIDIAISPDLNLSWDKVDVDMLSLTGNQGYMNKGTKIGSYAVDVGKKKVQVDLMFVDSKEWAKFIYHSAHGGESNYPGAVRNLLLMAAVRHTHEASKDVVVKKDGQAIARASRALKLNVGLERLFKMSKKNPKTGEWGGMAKVDPKVLQKYVDEITNNRGKFSHDAEIIDSPDEVAAFLFGDGVKAADIMTAEQVINQIKKRKNAAEIFKAAKEDLEKSKLPVPKEI